MVLDPAVGTGTFLIGAAAAALEVVEPQGSAVARRLIREHLLPHFYGFELLPAPYAVAHLKIGSFYGQDKYNCKLTEGQHARIYLSNTLHKDEHATGELELLPIFNAITQEANGLAFTASTVINKALILNIADTLGGTRHIEVDARRLRQRHWG